MLKEVKRKFYVCKLEKKRYLCNRKSKTYYMNDKAKKILEFYETKEEFSEDLIEAILRIVQNLSEDSLTVEIKSALFTIEQASIFIKNLDV